jgi:class 3 adenylate cyclase
MLAGVLGLDEQGAVLDDDADFGERIDAGFGDGFLAHFGNVGAFGDSDALHPLRRRLNSRRCNRLLLRPNQTVR